MEAGRDYKEVKKTFGVDGKVYALGCGMCKCLDGSNYTPRCMWFGPLQRHLTKIGGKAY